MPGPGIIDWSLHVTVTVDFAPVTAVFLSGADFEGVD